MSFITFNGLPVLRGRFVFPREGAWYASLDLDADDDAQLSGSASLVVGEASWRGFVRRAGVFAGAARVLVVGGAGGLGKPLASKFYQGAPLRLPLQDALSGAGETLSSSSDPSALGFLLPNWVRCAGDTAGGELASLAQLVGVSWRVLPSGEVFFGSDTFPALPGALVLYHDPARRHLILDLDAPDLMPGQSVNGLRVERVAYELSPTRFAVEAWTQ
jgi:hypothetical protein